MRGVSGLTIRLGHYWGLKAKTLVVAGTGRRFGVMCSPLSRTVALCGLECFRGNSLQPAIVKTYFRGDLARYSA